MKNVRVLDFTRVWAGPLAARILADLGADVIRVERPLPPSARFGAAGGGLRELNRNKRSIAIDLDKSDGRELVKQLARGSDAIIENFSSRVMPNFGLAWQQLRELNPALVMLSMPAYGSSGPYGSYVGAGPSIEPMTGFPNLLGYSYAEVRSSSIAHPDAVAGVSGAALLLIALLHARRTGQGQWIDLSQMEATISMIGEYYLAYQKTGLLPNRLPNLNPNWYPHGPYPCAGDDQWLAVSISDEESWRALCKVMRLDFGRETAPLRTVEGRRSRRAEIEAKISEWTLGRSKFEAMQLLQDAGVAAGAILDAREVIEDPQLAAVGFFARTGGRETSDIVPGSPIAVNGRLRPEWLTAPFVGEDSREILRSVLGLSENATERLIAAEVIGQT